MDRCQAALEYLFSATDYEKMRHVRYNADTFSLDRMRRLLSLVGSPDRRLRSVHVAGTKGKGSTSAMVERIARASGLKTGLYTSPHLVDIRERIRVGGAEVRPDELARLIEAARPAVERLRADADAATFFEIFTALAMMHFDEVRVDLAVVEVGLGGRLDATNVLAPDVSVITAISLDHMEQLGDTLALIAGEKAGIIKPGVPVVSQPQAAEALRVIECAAAAAGSPLTLVGRDVTYTWAPAEAPGTAGGNMVEGRRASPRLGGHMTIVTPLTKYADLFVPLMGEHQAINAAAAIAAVEKAPALAGRLTPALVRDALAEVDWPGRMEYVPGCGEGMPGATGGLSASASGMRPAMILDGAHNRASIEVLADALARHFPGRPMAILFGAAADKDIDGMMAALVEKLPTSPVIFTRAPSPRAADPADLAARYARVSGGQAGVRKPEIAEDLAAAQHSCARRHAVKPAGAAKVESIEDLTAALDAARRAPGADGLVVACGSLYLVGELKRRMLNLEC